MQRVLPIAPRTRLPAGPCIMNTIVKGNDFVREWPTKGFYCDGKLVDTGPVPN